MKINYFEKTYKIGRLVFNRKRVDNQRKTHPLNFIFWESTLRCCLHCRHCGLSCGDKVVPDELTAETVKKVFYDIAEKSDPAKIMIGVTGGEPLLRADLFEIMSYATKLGFPWGMVTNGFLINEKMIEKMKYSGMRTVAVSLDGLESTHNWMRNNLNSFHKAINALKLFKAAGFLEVVEAITSVSPQSLKELEQIYQLCLSLKLDQWRIMPIAPVGRAGKDEKICLNAVEMAKVLNFIKEKRNEGKIKVTLNEMWFCGPEFEFDVRDWGFFCPAGVNALAILNNGDINGCPLIEGMIEGNAKKDNVMDLWLYGFKNYRDVSWKKVGKCKDCEWFDFCAGDGLHLWQGDKKELKNCYYELIKEGYKKIHKK